MAFARRLPRLVIGRLVLGVGLGLAVVCAGLGVAAMPANAGGSWLYPLEDRYDVGDEATLSGTFGHGQLGWIEDGPFFAFLRVDPDAAAAAAPPDTWPYIDPSDLPLGEIELNAGGPFGMVGTVVFIVPEVEPGLYDIVYCNDPCTNGIGDLIGGTISIGEDPEVALSEASRQAALAEELGSAAAAVDPPASGDRAVADQAVGDQAVADQAVADQAVALAAEPSPAAAITVTTVAGDERASNQPEPTPAVPTSDGLHPGWYLALVLAGLAALATFGPRRSRREAASSR